MVVGRETEPVGRAGTSAVEGCGRIPGVPVWSGKASASKVA